MLKIILSKLKLLKEVDIVIDTEKKNKLITNLKNLSNDNGYYSPVFAFLDILVPATKKYIGTISENKITIRYKMGAFDGLRNMTIVKANYEKLNENFLLKLKFIGMNHFALAIRLILFIAYGICSFLLIFEEFLLFEKMNIIIQLILLSLIAFIVIILPIIISKYNVEKMKQYFEKLIHE